MIDEFLKLLKSTFEENANEDVAPQMAAYMKDHFPFLGIKSPQRKEILKPFLKEKINSFQELKQIVSELWSWDEREFQYAAMEILYRHRKLLAIDSIPFLSDLVVKKSWWDTVDLLAAKIIGPILLKYPDKMEGIVDPWISSDNLWLNRTAIIFQLKYKEAIRLDLLTRAIEAHAESTEFFHAKAIGWALRQHSKIDPEWVGAFIDSHSLRPLSVREGSKYL